MKRFALIGAAGYIADRHMKAIKETGNQLVCASDRFDVMGRIDRYSPETEFFLEHENLDKYMDDLRMRGAPIDYVSICTPNYMHPSHIRFALRNGADAICEKPLVIFPEDIHIIKDIETETGKKVYTVLQLRYHPTILKLKKEIEEAGNKIHDIDLSYITTRGKWYFKSWKGDIQKSGGVATNIGIHFFDMLTWIFGNVKENIVHVYDHNKAAGYLQLEKARVRWFLSLDSNDLPKAATDKGMRTFRSITVDNKEVEFSGGFTDLHTITYQNILNGNGFGIDDARESIELTNFVRNSKPVGLRGEYHPFLVK
ncbi:MAG: Gfo/Idh/MocA family oxidoreductase [Prolixibacteraceae bacterium]|jgi:UDP-N-acetyl-2-amino-2-deoxyglucuronate dehydrogenase|nr:Gfo/Idh/MocA family oxidoreductase [Prolixibacteraceae bacterium]MBT6767126.1 Gfo/Idh/MocA family oxidoreductase [Prolixibacteraceae bacterium]MBT7000532.1 Gfo/Idh/MocA family oxidoreductase [Prolixibacteraceae bacterium]MBT7393480.1 Gfo/Idh/MocA family oxidoreductase [Prolixibacteraceae bacterium]